MRVVCTAVTWACLQLGMSVSAQPARFDGDRVVRVVARDDAQLAQILSLTDDVWSHGVAVDVPIEVRVNPVQAAAMDAAGIRYEVFIADVQAEIDRIDLQTRGATGLYDQFLPLADVQARLAALEALNPQIASRVTIGTSLEGRPMQALRITGSGDPSQKPSILIHGGIHAREWVTVSVVLYLADRLTTTYASDPQVRALVDRIDWYILPVMNPDGYLYSWEWFRFQRKNMRLNSDGSLGVDLNRNFGHQWGGQGSSSVGWHENYRGPAPFSEPETQAIRDFMLSLPNPAGYMDIHSYSQLLMWPWAYTATRCEDHGTFREIGEQMQTLTRDVYGRNYGTGPVNTTIYPAAGNTVDWVYAATDAMPMSYELRDAGTFGFLLPPDQILPNAEEVWPAILFYADQVTAPLSIRFPDGLPETIPPVISTPVVAEVRTNFGTEAVSEVRMYVRDGVKFVPQPMAHDGNGRYTASIRAGVCGSTSFYYVEAVGANGSVQRSPALAPGALHQTYAADVLPFVSYDFSNGPSGFQSAAFALLDGRWAWGTPTGTMVGSLVAEPEGGNPNGSGGQCWSTKPAQDENPESSDVDGGPTRLTTPFFPLGDLADPHVTFAFWYFNTSQETMSTEISADASNWTSVGRYDSANAWRQGAIRVRDHLPDATQCMVRFSVQDGGVLASVTEAALDDVMLATLGCTVVDGDLNCDGVISVGDIAPFVLALTNPGAYEAEYPGCDIERADVNDDGVISVGDITGLVGLITGA